MKHFRELLFVLLGFILGIVIIVGCAANVEEEAPSPEKEVASRETVQVEEITKVKQGQNEQVTEDCDAIRNELEVIQAKYKALQFENSELNAKFTALTADYDELTAKYNNLLEGTPDITESDVEQAIFKIINKRRQDSGLNELEWADSFYERAKAHSDYLVTRNLVEVADQPYWQEVFRAAGYSSLDRITNAVWMVWKENTTFTQSILNQQAKYGTVAVSKSGDIFYITYFASPQK